MKNNMFSAFESKPFVFMWLAELFTQIPINLLNFLLILVVFTLTKSNTAVAGVVLSFTLPAVFFGIPAGVYIDKWNKKKVLLFSNVSRTVLLVMLALFPTNLVVIYTVSFLTAVITQFFIPAETAIIPLIVTKRQLLSANALFSIGIFGSVLVAYLISGHALLFLGTVKTLLVLSMLLLAGAFLISLITVPLAEQHKQFAMSHLQIPWKAFLKEVSGVLRIIHRAKQVGYSLFLLAVSQILILVIAAVAPGYANEVLKISIEQFPLLVIAPAALGIIVGALLIANVLPNKDKVIMAGIYLSGLALIIMPYGNRLASRDFIKTINHMLPHRAMITNIDIIVVLAFLLGVANACIFVPANTIVQEETAEEMRGKIYGVLNTLVGIFSFIPIIAVGGFSDLIGVSRVIVGIGVIILLFGVGKQLFGSRAKKV